MLEIDIRPWDEVEIDEIVGAVYSTLCGAIEATNEDLSSQLQEELCETDCSLVLAWENARLVGLFALSPATRTTLILNPGQILGGYSQVLPDNMPDSISAALVENAVAWGRKEGYRRIELILPLTTDGQIDRALGSRYESLGFSLKLSYVEMICDLARHTLPPPSVSGGLKLLPLREALRDELYRCYQAAFQAGDAQFFPHQTEQEQQAYFDTLGLEEARDEPASLVLRQDGRLVGFALVLPYGRMNRHNSCMCIHPEWQRNGLGKALLTAIIWRAKQKNMKTVTLGTEMGMRAFNLYRQYNFEIVEGSAVYQLCLVE
jgi:GNAT superfamily N-acetyltransferase